MAKSKKSKTEKLTMEQIRDKARNDPDSFMEEVLGIKLWDKQREILKALNTGNRVAVKSANSMGKTWSAGRLVLWYMIAYAPCVVVTTSKSWRQVENQLWREIRQAHKKSIIPLGGKIGKTKLEIDEKWFAIGVASGDSEATQENFQGWHAENILFILDEASGIGKYTFDALEGGMAGGEAKVLMIGNPTRTDGGFADAFKDKNVKKITINAELSPNVKAGETVVPGLATKEWVDQMKEKYGKDHDMYRVRVLGKFPKRNSDTFIPVDHIIGAQDNDRPIVVKNAAGKPYKQYIMLDPARYGDDRAVFGFSTGNYAKILEKIDQCSIVELTNKAVMYLNKYPRAIIKIDVIGLGAGVYDNLRAMPKYRNRVQGVNVAKPAIDNEQYNNLRTEGWADMRDWLKTAVLKKDGDWDEMSVVKYTINSKGQTCLESKDKIKGRGYNSPDVGDMLALRFQRATEGNYIIPKIL